VDTETGRILGTPALRHRSSLGPRSAVQPVATECRAVVLECREARQLLARADWLIVRVGDVGQRTTVDLARQLGKGAVERIDVVPREVENRLGEFTAFLLIQLPHLEEDERQDLLIQLRVAWRRQGDVLPLQPARRVDKGTVLFGEAGTGQ